MAKTPVPTSFLRPDEEASVKAIDTQIANKQQELQAVIADKPVYALPDMYRMKENKEMSDEEYIQYLASTDTQRMSEKAKRNEEKEARHREKAQKIADGNYGEKTKIAGGVISKIIFCLTAICVNPLLTGYIRNMGKKVPVWLLIIVSIIGFFAGVLTFPTA